MAKEFKPIRGLMRVLTLELATRERDDVIDLWTAQDRLRDVARIRSTTGRGGTWVEAIPKRPDLR